MYEHIDIESVQNLWVRVLERVHMDLSTGDADPDWYNSRDFILVCHYAGVDPKRTRAQALIKDPLNKEISDGPDESDQPDDSKDLRALFRHQEV